MKPIVVDKGGGTRDLDWLTEKYGVTYVPAPVTEKRFALYQVCETEGPATVVVRVIQGLSGLPSHAVALSWASAPTDLTTPEARAFKTRYRPRAAVQWTNGIGDTGFGLGADSYIKDVKAGGPHAAWVLHHLYQSDVLDGIGMLGGTDHLGPLRLVFELAEAEPGPVVEPKGWFCRVLAWLAERWC